MPSNHCSVTDCTRPVIARQLCMMHYQRKKRTGTTDGRISAVDELRRLAAIDTDDCVLWTMSVKPGHRGGYAQLQHQGKLRTGHQVVCEWTHGPRPAGMEAAHDCNVRACVNPRHLSWKTRTENVHDMKRHGTWNHGQTHSSAKLCEADVIAMRCGVETVAAVAARVGCAYRTAWMAAKGKTWAHLNATHPPLPIGNGG